MIRARQCDLVDAEIPGDEETHVYSGNAYFLIIAKGVRDIDPAGVVRTTRNGRTETASFSQLDRLLPACVPSRAGEAKSDKPAIFDCWQIIHCPTDHMRREVGTIIAPRHEEIRSKILDCLEYELKPDLHAAFSHCQKIKTRRWDRGLVCEFMPLGSNSIRSGIIVSNTYANHRRKVITIVPVERLREHHLQPTGRLTITPAESPKIGNSYIILERQTLSIDPCLVKLREVDGPVSPEAMRKIVAQVAEYFALETVKND